MAEHLQAFLRTSVRQRSREVKSGPFACFFNDDDPLEFFNYAIPERPLTVDDAVKALPALEDVFAAANRLPRFEFVVSYAPGLREALEARGYATEPQSIAMTCTQADLCAPPFDPAFTFDFVDDATPDAALEASMRVRAAAFEAPLTFTGPAAIADLRASARQSPVALASLEGEVIGAGSVTPVIDGVAEIGGIAVAQHVRRRGAGGTLAALLALRAFHAGAQTVFLTAADRTAAGVYARTGFRESPHIVVAMRR